MTTALLDLSLPVALSLFTDLVGRPVTGTEVDARELGGATDTVRGVYKANGGDAGAVYLLDVELAASLGAALVMIPTAQVAECVHSATLLPLLVDNCFEVLNVTSRLINRAGGVHYQLREQVLPGVLLPDDAAVILVAPSQRVDLDLTVSGYGRGRLTILVG